MSLRILLLRAVNVGGARLPMAELRVLVTELGATDVTTYIASGNLLCRPPAGEPEATFDRRLEQAIEGRFGFFREVISRTPAEVAAALADHPFEVLDPKFSYVHFLLAEPSPEVVATLAASDFGDDRCQVIGREVHLRYAAGAGTSKLTAAVLARRLGVQGTARNLDTVAKLVALAS